jgi:hypothetical protein
MKHVFKEVMLGGWYDIRSAPEAGSGDDPPTAVQISATIQMCPRCPKRNKEPHPFPVCHITFSLFV